MLFCLATIKISVDFHNSHTCIDGNDDDDVWYELWIGRTYEIILFPFIAALELEMARDKSENTAEPNIQQQQQQKRNGKQNFRCTMSIYHFHLNR